MRLVMKNFSAFPDSIEMIVGVAELLTAIAVDDTFKPLFLDKGFADAFKIHLENDMVKPQVTAVTNSQYICCPHVFDPRFCSRYTVLYVKSKYQEISKYL